MEKDLRVVSESWLKTKEFGASKYTFCTQTKIIPETSYTYYDGEFRVENKYFFDLVEEKYRVVRREILNDCIKIINGIKK